MSNFAEVRRRTKEIETAPSLDGCKKLILSIVKLLDSKINTEDLNLFELFTDDGRKLAANASWFISDSKVKDHKATYQVHERNELNIDFKLFGVQNTSKRVISWSQALVDAAGTGYKGIRGYLATVTSASESDFIGLMIGAPGPGYNPIGIDGGYYWVGGSDKETESVWKWVTGPEKGNLIGSYSNWFPGFNSQSEPNGAPIQAQRDEDGLALDRTWGYSWYDLPVEDINFPYGQYVKEGLQKSPN